MINNRVRYGHVYTSIFLIKKQKLSNLDNVRSQNFCTLRLRFFSFERYVPSIGTAKNSTRSHEDSRTKSRIKFLTSFL